MADAAGGQADAAPDAPDGSASRPRILADSRALAGAEPEARGAVWRLDETQRHLDANVIALPPGGRIDEHVGPAEDVLLHVVAGSGTLRSGDAELELATGAILWLPRRSRREVTAGSDGLRYLSVHRRKPGLQIGRRVS